ncbi:kinase-like domain-containing protein, partial [Schizophyllum commune]
QPFLPSTLRLWIDVFWMRDRVLGASYLIWRYLADVFSRRGYALYVPRNIRRSNSFEIMVYPLGFMASTAHEDEHGGLELASVHPPYRVCMHPVPEVIRLTPDQATPYTWAAVNRAGKHFVIKVISDGQGAQGLNELKILKYLARQDLRADPRNRAIPVVEYIEYEHYVFAIFPRWTPFPYDDIQLPMTAIECCVQITEVVAFLHENRVAHMGISPHNIMINYAGHLIPQMKPLGEHLPVKYYLIDFGPSILLEESSGPLVPPLRLAPHRTSAPEVDSGDPFDPFAADVYQTAVFMLEHFYDLTGFTSEFLPILQAMTRSPEERISMKEAHSRLLALRNAWMHDPSPAISNSTGETRNKYYETRLNAYRAVPGSLRMPMDDAEARSLRAYMRELRDSEILLLANFNHPPDSWMLQVDPIPRTFGCVRGDDAREDAVGE